MRGLGLLPPKPDLLWARASLGAYPLVSNHRLVILEQQHPQEVLPEVQLHPFCFQEDIPEHGIVD